MSSNIDTTFQKKHSKWAKIVLCVVLGLMIVYAISISLGQVILRQYIKSFDAVEYEDQLVPEIGEEGYYTFTSDEDLKILQLNDLHIGGGIFSLNRDKKTVYEVMSIVQSEKPDLVILNGDSIYALPTIGWNSGGTLNNKMVSKDVILIFETLQVYYSVTFGNHDTEAFDFTSRKGLGDLYMNDKYKYCIFNKDYDGYGVTNQCILLKNSAGDINKAIMLLDSNAYIDDSLSACINWQYDTIHDEQVEWAADTIKELSAKAGHTVKSLFFFHIPTGEFDTAYKELEANDFNDTETTQYVCGVWDEVVDEELGGRVWYGGCAQRDVAANDVDKFFETLGPDGLNSVEGIFVGHDHMNSGTVMYRGVMLAYGNSIDNVAYTGIHKCGLQRGGMVITVSPDGSWTQVHKNAYTDYGVSTDKFFDVQLDTYYNPGIEVPKNRKTK